MAWWMWHWAPRQVDMFVVRKANRSYPATVTLGPDVAYTDLQGTLLQNKNCKRRDGRGGSARGDMRRQGTWMFRPGKSSAQSWKAAEHLGPLQNTGTRPVQKLSEERQLQVRRWRRCLLPLPVAPCPMRRWQLCQKVSPGTSRDDRYDAPIISHHSSRPESKPCLEQNERFSVEFEVKNEGPTVADAVAVALSGHPATL